MKMHRCYIFVSSLMVMMLLSSSAFIIEALEENSSNADKYLLRRRNNRELTMGDRLRSISTPPQQSVEPVIPTPRIIGGSVVTDPTGRYPYFALMRGQNLCGAVLVSSKFVLTAAHCAYADDDFGIKGREYGYKTGRIHPRYDQGDVSNDIAIFELESEVPNARPAKMRKEPVTTSGMPLTVIGYGDTNPSDAISDTSSQLREVTLRYVTADRCDSDFGSNWFTGSYIDDGMMCALSPGKDSCGGDSGGPLLIKGSDPSQDELVGLVSWGVSCADDDYPGVYTRISHYFDWIQQTACELNPAAVPIGMSCPGVSPSQPSSPGGGSGSGTVVDYEDKPDDDDWFSSLWGGNGGGDIGSDDYYTGGGNIGGDDYYTGGSDIGSDDYYNDGYDINDESLWEATVDTVGSWFNSLFDW